MFGSRKVRDSRWWVMLETFLKYSTFIHIKRKEKTAKKFVGLSKTKGSLTYFTCSCCALKFNFEWSVVLKLSKEK